MIAPLGSCGLERNHRFSSVREQGRIAALSSATLRVACSTNLYKVVNLSCVRLVCSTCACVTRVHCVPLSGRDAAWVDAKLSNGRSLLLRGS